jgi:histidyl-tRNA synthetase
MSKKTIQKPRGTQDILPQDQRYWDFVTETFKRVAERNGFGLIITPTFEDTALFERGVGSGTDIVEKEMYTFKDRSDNLITLKPEGTAPVARAYLEDGMSSLPQPVKLYYITPVFRYERPQAGRLREHHQFGAEVIGDGNPLVDVDVISMAWRAYTALGFKNISLQINSIGCPNCRPNHLKEIKTFYKDKLENICNDCKNRYEKNPLRLLDCKQEVCQKIAEEAPKSVNNLCSDCHSHFKTILEYLDELEIPYTLNTKLVRGLDYYTRTVFEIWYSSDTFGSQNAIGGGGRYDLLIEMIGGKPTPGFGLGVGIERIILALKDSQIDVPAINLPKIYVAQLGESAKKIAFILLQQLLNEQIPVIGNFNKLSIGEQLKAASELQVPYSIIIGQKEVIDGTVIIKDMYTGFQEVISLDKAVSEISKRLS